jgi:hypothetical protein
METLMESAAETLRQAAQETPKTSRRLFAVMVELIDNELAEYPDAWVVLPLKKIVSEVSAEARGEGATLDPTATKRTVLAILRSIGEAGFGRLFIGRRGAVTRFVLWPGDEDDVSLIAALKDQIKVMTKKTRLLKRQFSVRPNHKIELRLPENLTDREANQLARFVLGLPSSV